MANCVVCGKVCSSECCSGACRAKKSRRTVERTQAVRTVKAHAAHGVIIDACGTEHKIDYEDRRKDEALLESWYAGKGTPYQARLGELSMQYDVFSGHRYPKDNNYKLTDAGHRYLGQEVAA